MKIEQKQSQKQIFSQTMGQSLEILQMNVQTLSQFIYDFYNENPIIEIESENDNQQLPEDDFSYDDEFQQTKKRTSESEYIIPDEVEESLHEYIIRQLLLKITDQQMYYNLSYLINCLNEKGYFPDSFQQYQTEMNISRQKLQQLVSMIQDCEPYGVGAFSLKESLMIQLRHLNLENSLAYRIVDENLLMVARHQYKQLADLYNESYGKIEREIYLISQLNPAPASRFNKDKTIYIKPDITVSIDNNEFLIAVNKNLIPVIKINDIYRNMALGDDKELAKYLMTNLKKADSVVQQINSRFSTLELIAEYILSKQQSFFLKGPGHLKPLTISDVAMDLGFSESTISRAFSDKYLKCSWGMFPLNYFLSKKITNSCGDDKSVDQIKRYLKDIISKEDHSKPLRDEQIAEILSKKGFTISRRTIAKYRSELRIPTCGKRKDS